MNRYHITIRVGDRFVFTDISMTIEADGNDDAFAKAKEEADKWGGYVAWMGGLDFSNVTVSSDPAQIKRMANSLMKAGCDAT